MHVSTTPVYSIVRLAQTSIGRWYKKAVPFVLNQTAVLQSPGPMILITEYNVQAREQIRFSRLQEKRGEKPPALVTSFKLHQINPCHGQPFLIGARMAKGHRLLESEGGRCYLFLSRWITRKFDRECRGPWISFVSRKHRTAIASPRSY